MKPLLLLNPGIGLLYSIEEIQTGLLIGHGKKAKFYGIFRGKFAKKSADFTGFSREKSQNLRKNRPISRDFRRGEVKICRKIGSFRGILAEKMSNFKGFSGANS